jgi:hypothetical protein
VSELFSNRLFSLSNLFQFRRASLFSHGKQNPRIHLRTADFWSYIKSVRIELYLQFLKGTAMNRGIIIVLLMISITGAETIGDFAPLDVGNIWVYDYTVNHTTAAYQEVMAGTYTVTLTHLAENDDTVFYYLENRLYYTGTIDSFAEKTSQDVRVFDKLFSDTLFEVNDTIWKPRMAHVFPVRYSHEVDIDAEYIDSVESINGAYEFSSATNSTLPHPSYELYSSYRFRAGVGIKSYRYSTDMHMNQSTVLYELRSFNDESSALLPVNSLLKATVHSGYGNAYSKITLPRIAIARDGKTYNLLGRVHKNDENRRVNGARHWHEHLFDLFR